MPSVEELKAALAEAELQRLQQYSTQGSVPSPQSEDRYAASSWGTNEYDFIVPSGQTCRMRRLPIEKLAQVGILDKITRLPGLTAEIVKAAEGAPPEAVKMPPTETIDLLSEIVDQLMPIVVLKPEVLPIPESGEERIPGKIYVDTVDFGDKVAILNKATEGLVKFDTFRAGSQLIS
jgi:hypothetical protein